jgi:peptide/nickel transport system permease protein
MNWIVTTVDSIPGLYLLILFAAVLSPSAESLILAVVLLGWTGTLRLIRGQTLALRNREYIHAAQALGASPWRIMFSHIMPNLISVTVVSLAINIAGLILTESALSFLGLGVQPPQATWGNMLSKSQQFFRQGAHLVIFPGLMIFITVLAFFVVGDGIRDAFDPTITDD